MKCDTRSRFQVFPLRPIVKAHLLYVFLIHVSIASQSSDLVALCPKTENLDNQNKAADRLTSMNYDELGIYSSSPHTARCTVAQGCFYMGHSKP